MKWAFSEKHSSENTAFPLNLHRTIICFKALNSQLENLKEFFVPLQNIYFERTIETM